MSALPSSEPSVAPRSRFLVAVLASCGLATALMQTVIIPLQPRLPQLTHSTPTATSWLITTTLLAGAVCTPVLGRVGDVYGKRRVLLALLAVLVVGSVLCATSSQIEVLIVGRVLQGAALGTVPLGISIMRDELPPGKLLSSAALMSSTIGIGGALGLPIAALVVQHADWHILFWASAILGVVALVLVLLVVPESPQPTGGRFDAVGTLGLTSFLVALLLAVSQGSDWGWTSARILGLFAASVLIGPLWGWYEQRTAVPMVDMRTLARPAVLLTNLGALLIGLAFFANTLVTAQLVQEPKSTGYGLGASLVVGGLCSMPGGVVMVLLSPVSARISRRLGPKTTLAQGAALMLVGYLVRFETSHRLWTIIAGATVVAAGTALAYSALPALMMRAVPASETAAANGLNTLMRTIGQAFSSTVIASILTSITFQVGGRTAPTFHAYQLIFLFAAAAALLALVIALLIPSGARGGDGNDARPWRHGRRLHPRLSTGHLG